MNNLKTFIAGTIYGGITFSSENNNVNSIFIVARAE